MKFSPKIFKHNKISRVLKEDDGDPA